ncbi:alpha-2-macroglobulin [Trichonephila clavipes]|nr:alpha-2-macroglobulin [Trichonephila clavipes]
MDEILITARDLELEVNEDDIEELLMGHEDKLTIEELQETQRNVSPSEQEEDERGPMPTSAIKDLLKKWTDVRAMVLEWHPNQADVNRDTVVALQALAHYSSLLSTTPIDIGLVIESDELVKGFKVNSENKLVTQSAQIPVLPAVVDLQAVGDGCALVQFSMRYNVQKVSGGEFFDMNINVARLGSSTCNTPKINICMRGATANKGPRPTVPNSVYATLSPEVPEQMFQSGGHLTRKTPVLSYQTS